MVAFFSVLVTCVTEVNSGSTAESANEAAPDGNITKTAAFSGNHTYTVAGTARFIEQSDGSFVLNFSSDFSASAGPGLDVVLSAGASVTNPQLNLGDLKAFSGSQNYSIPSGTNIDQFTHVVIHCVPANLPFGAGEFK